MSNRIRILIADDQAISREGIRRILEREDDIEIAGVLETAPEVLPQVRVKKPDVILLDLKWHHDDQAMSDVITQLRQEHPKLCIIGLTVYDHLVQWARTAGATWVVTKDIGKDELLRLIRAAHASTEVVGPKELEEAKLALKCLRGLQTGQQYAVEYEKKVLLILKTVLHPHLTDPRSQTRTLDGERRYDILFSNYSFDPFWQKMGQVHNATLVVFEVKNVAKLRVRYIDQVAVGYLKPGVGHLGFLVSRAPVAKSMLRHAVNLFKNERKAIIFMCDDDLEEMLKLKETGREPTGLIRKRYDDFIIL
jgi:DNA-binding NarL/FixJ family response regulator